MAENGWEEWGKHVLTEVERLHDGQEETTKAIFALREEIIVGRSKVREEIAADRVENESRSARNTEAIGTLKWFMRALVAATVIAFLGGMVETVNSCRLQDARAEVTSPKGHLHKGRSTSRPSPTSRPAQPKR